MSVRVQRVMSGDEYHAMNEAAMRRGYYCDDRRVFLPGMAWECPWLFDPVEDKGQRWARYMSEFYYKDWADKRPPITVVCPNGRQWTIDQVSSNGAGWKVTIKNGLITCHPSIVVPGYHGWLRDGVFTPDIEGRGEFGTVEPHSTDMRHPPLPAGALMR